MRKASIVLLLVLLFVPVFCQNESLNFTNMTDTNMTISDDGPSSFFDTEGPEMTTLVILIGLVAVYIIGKLAFKLIKWAIIVALLVLIFQVLF